MPLPGLARGGSVAPGGAGADATIRRLKVDGTDIVPTIDPAKLHKHVVATAQQAAAAQGEYTDTTFVTDAQLLIDAANADPYSFALSKARSPRYDVKATVMVDHFEKTRDIHGLPENGVGKPVTQTVNQQSLPCEIGVVKKGQNRADAATSELTITHFQLDRKAGGAP